MPEVNAACAEERRAHCAAVPATAGRVLNCLLARAEERLDFSPACVDRLQALAARRLQDWRTGARRGPSALQARLPGLPAGLLHILRRPLRLSLTPLHIPLTLPPPNRLPAGARVPRRRARPLRRSDCHGG